MKTHPIYMSDPYQKEMDAKILDIVHENDTSQRILLDKTIFYPMGGGQPTDQGIISFNEKQFQVYQVMIVENEIWHYVKNGEFEIGMQVHGEINWERRYQNMKVHSAGHVIDFALMSLGISPKEISPLKADHGKKPFIVYNGESKLLNKEILEEKIQELIQKNLSFSWEFISYDELAKRAAYLQPNLPKNKPLRALTLETVGTVADGGTIVKQTSEVEGIVIESIKIEDKTTYIYYSVNKERGPKTKENANLGVTLEPKLQEKLDAVKLQIKNAKSEDDLTILWRSYLGKSGELTQMLKQISQMPNSERKSYGLQVNTLKTIIDLEIENAKGHINQKKLLELDKNPLSTLTTKKNRIGHIHPLTQTIQDLNTIFKNLGYSIMDGPEIETDEYCFQRLNVPMDHPARDLQDSIFVEEPHVLLRTQTSSIEARTLEKFKPPFKVVMPGRVYRNEKVNRSNHFTFHQYQLVVVQEKVSLAELISTIDHLFKTHLGPDVKTRFRNKYYPEVEPGVGPDMLCFDCKGSGCPLCKGRGWLEMGGAGIIHPNVLKSAGLEPKEWQGYAFGLGLDRWAMAKHNITDIRTLLGGNLAYKPYDL